MDHHTKDSSDSSPLTLSSQATPDGTVVAPQQVVENLGGQNLSPDLTWSGAPEGTRSFAVTLFDPDAPTGSGFWHWIAWDIPAGTTSLPLGVARDDTSLRQAVNDFGNPGYDGPEPPAGPSHRYVFTVHALPVESLDADPEAPHVGTRFAIFSQQLASASFTGHYQVDG
ncbi:MULTISPECIES: YbhB/YbcL family Raf kinase inhibitor-like protein [Brachybacterium]|uniref:Kinase inhibitor n=1 Tax=Brachybacterium alimentarium TaxID=47845 RepID=A0A2A3YIJ4_9MICO|nr:MULTISPECIES: YbhB/YbcL family Raf kinase inhibitor-like protein [Brachybacterium]PCC31486.1 kinase inhibitor [Brachybacterium alimentarium]PCC39572.1 kinase inhibitor [Brachybacterium alimentarium]RCS65050.1 YbhB/YbcL family Raf kinase inhibitor-like protein [Brachybacterium sp. JB7]RCS68784.1 YbhB/YbcL family Raf kinase inhibitor-like protein [Brachybacterium alimentarium]RCS75762.1 YbhB/YbcL family Raf kinase inhibitor-like protein [Brachybacterium alimentarium]